MALNGRCLCGAVIVRVASHAGAVSACHCVMCRRWGGGVTMGLEAPAGAVRVSGPVRSFASSDFAERAWCETCGTQLWLRDRDGPYDLSPGLFDGAGLRLVREVYADRAEIFAFAGDHERVTAVAYEAAHRHVGVVR